MQICFWGAKIDKMPEICLFLIWFFNQLRLIMAPMSATRQLYLFCQINLTKKRKKKMLLSSGHVYVMCVCVCLHQGSCFPYLLVHCLFASAFCMCRALNQQSDICFPVMWSYLQSVPHILPCGCGLMQPWKADIKDYMSAVFCTVTVWSKWTECFYIWTVQEARLPSECGPPWAFTTLRKRLLKW